MVAALGWQLQRWWQRLGSNYIWKVEPIALDDGLGVWYERKWAGKDDAKDFWPWQLKLWIGIYYNGKNGRRRFSLEPIKVEMLIIIPIEVFYLSFFI